MEVSQLKVSDALRHQNSTKTKILLWMQEHPQLCTNTNISKMAKSIHGLGVSEMSKRVAMQNMVNTQLITRFGTKQKSRFLINYLHKDITPEVLEGAPMEDQKRVAQIKANALAEGKKITEEGVIVTKKEEEKQEEVDKQAEEDKHVSSKPVEVQTQMTKGEKQITITINLKIEG